MSSYVSRTAPQQPYYQRQGAYAPPAPQRVGANVKDDYERELIHPLFNTASDQNRLVHGDNSKQQNDSLYPFWNSF